MKEIVYPGCEKGLFKILWVIFLIERRKRTRTLNVALNVEIFNMKEQNVWSVVLVDL